MESESTRAVATVIDTKVLTLPFVARDRTFWASFDSEPEAHYVAAFLNSDHAAEIIGGWMNLGLFGRRDINKRILDVRWPRFDPETADHRGLSNAAADLSKEAKSLLKELPKTKAGSQRHWMRDHLPKLLLQTVERFVKQISEKP